MSAEDEAKITYDFLTCPVLVEGILYEANQMTYFNGQRLHFIFSKGGVLNAFKTAAELERYVYDEYGYVFVDRSENSKLDINIDILDGDELDENYNYYYEDWFYGGKCVAIPYDWGVPDLSDCGDGFDMNDCIDSAHTFWWSELFDDTGYTGWSILIAPNDWWWFSGIPQDSTSSIWVYESYPS